MKECILQIHEIVSSNYEYDKWRNSAGISCCRGPILWKPMFAIPLLCLYCWIVLLRNVMKGAPTRFQPCVLPGLLCAPFLIHPSSLYYITYKCSLSSLHFHLLHSASSWWSNHHQTTFWWFNNHHLWWFITQLDKTWFFINQVYKFSQL